MSSESKALNNQANLTDEDVKHYLRQHPDFLEQHIDLLDILIPPSTGENGIVDFQMILVEKLKADKKRLSEERRELIETATHNMTNWNRIQSACLALLEAEDFEDFVNIIAQDFPVILNVDVCCLAVEAYGNEVPNFKHPCFHVLTPGAVKDRLGKGGYACLQGDIFGDDDIYGPSAERVKSEALIRLDIAPKSHKGLLAFGSEDPAMFDPDQSIEQIAFLGQVVERFIRQFIKL